MFTLYRCDGGFPTAVWHYWVNRGIVTGGMYNTSAGCKPYTIKSCNHTLPAGPSRFEPTPSLPDCNVQPLTPICSNECVKNYPIPYKEDLHFGEFFYSEYNIM